MVWYSSTVPRVGSCGDTVDTDAEDNGADTEHADTYTDVDTHKQRTLIQGI